MNAVIEPVQIPTGRVRFSCSHWLCPNADTALEPEFAEFEVRSFLIDKHEVSRARFRRCVEAGRCTPDDHWWTKVWVDAEQPSALDVERLPVTNITVDQAQQFCAWSGGRLPTELEWVRAARGGTLSHFAWGDEDAVCERAVVDGCTPHPLPVDAGSRDLSPFGIAHMTGNVAEYVVRDPNHGVDPRGDVLRIGNSWRANPVLKGYISNIGASVPSSDAFWDDTTGFRCAYDAAPGPGRTPETIR